MFSLILPACRVQGQEDRMIRVLELIPAQSRELYSTIILPQIIITPKHFKQQYGFIVKMNENEQNKNHKMVQHELWALSAVTTLVRC